jgi:hypothetical protein
MLQSSAKRRSGGKIMSMQSLNQLVARSIVDPAVVRAFDAGQLSTVLDDLEFSTELRASLLSAETNSLADFFIHAYRLTVAAEQPVSRIQLPSPLEGLLPDTKQSDNEQVA